MSSPRSTASIPIAAVQSRLELLLVRIRAAAKRSRRFSWYSWGFLFAVVGATVVFYVLLILQVTAFAAGPNSGASITNYLWLSPLALIPAFLLVALAVREIVLGNQEASENASLPTPGTGEVTGGSPLSWTEIVRQSQELLTHMKSETEVSFIPLFLGVLSLTEFLGGSLLSVLLANDSSIGPLGILLIYGVGVPFLLLLIPLYLSSRRWIRSYQSLLETQVGELSRLEGEFFTRFAGVAEPG